jgi:hypothetical protein
MKRALLGLCMLALSCSIVKAQEVMAEKSVYLHSGKIGLGLDGITGSTNLLLKYFVNNQLALQVIAGFDLDQPGGDAPQGSTKEMGMMARGGLSLLYHLTQDQVSPYVGIEGIFQYDKAGGFFAIVPDAKNSVLASGVLGGEYFINERFTIGIKQSLGVSVQLKRDVPKEETDIMFNTLTLVTGRFYFN